MLVCSYFVKLQRKNERALESVLDDDVTTTWSTPSIVVQSAAVVLQNAYRYITHRCQRDVRAQYEALGMPCSHVVI